MNEQNYAIEIKDLTKRYDGFTLDKVSFSVPKGSIMGFIVSQTGKGSFVKGQNRELVREEFLRQTEALLTRAVEKAQIGGITLEELHELLDLIYGGE